MQPRKHEDTKKKKILFVLFVTSWLIAHGAHEHERKA